MLLKLIRGTFGINRAPRALYYTAKNKKKIDSEAENDSLGNRDVSQNIVTNKFRMAKVFNKSPMCTRTSNLFYI